MQFGYKEGHSTTLCTLIYKEVIDHYINNDSTVYSCLDASKAFDRAHGKLFSILLSKNIPKIVVRLYFYSYMRQKACVSWDHIKTSYVSMSNGVKQGGVISSISFSLYIQVLIVTLTVLHSFFDRSFMYAAPTLWNILDLDIRLLPFDAFKKRVMCM